MNLNRITLVLSIGTVLFSFYGMLKLAIFYIAFYVDILYFIQVNDLIIASFEGILSGLIVLTPIFVILFSSINQKRLVQNKSSSIRQFIKQQPIFCGLLAIIYFGALIYIVPAMFGKYGLIQVLPNVVTVLFVLTFVFPMFAYRALDAICILQYGHKMAAKWKILVSILLLLNTYYVFDAYEDIALLMRDNYSIDTVVHFKNGTKIQGDSTQYYIGNTSKYLFIYNDDSIKTTMYPMDQVSKIEF